MTCYLRLYIYLWELHACSYFLVLGLCTQLLPVLASALEFGSAAAPALTVLLKMGSWLPADQFSTKVIFFLWNSSMSSMVNTRLMMCLFEKAGAYPFQVLPTIVKLFASNDRAIRVSLLQHIDQFGESLTAQTVDEQVCDLFPMG